MSQTTAIEKKTPSPVDLVRQTLEDNSEMIARVAANRVSAAQLVSVAIQQMIAQPKLLECDPRTIAGALVNAGRLGLMPDPQLRQCALVPRWNKHLKGYACHLWIQVGGWVQLVKRADKSIRIEAKTVREHDHFEYEYGTTQFLRHRVTKSRSERGELTHTYAIAHFANGQSQFYVMDREDIERIRNVSDAKDQVFWRVWYEEMAQAKAGKGLCKWLAVSTEQAQLAVGLDDQMDANVVQTSPIDAPPSLEAAAQQVVDTQVGKTASASQEANNIDPEIISVETQQAVLEAAQKAGIKPERAVSAMLDLQIEAIDRMSAKTPPKTVYQDLAAKIAKLINTYVQLYIEREAKRQEEKKPGPTAQAQAPTPAAPQAPTPAAPEAPTSENPWQGSDAGSAVGGPNWASSEAYERPAATEKSYDADDPESLAGMFD